jgi:hypothetical protein
MMSKGKRIIEILTDENPDAIIYDGMDDALIGIYRGDLARTNGASIAVYSYVKFIQIYIERDGMSEEEAIEFFDYNVAGGYIGKYQPYIIDDTGV